MTLQQIKKDPILHYLNTIDLGSIEGNFYEGQEKDYPKLLEVLEVDEFTYTEYENKESMLFRLNEVISGFEGMDFPRYVYRSLKLKNLNELNLNELGSHWTYSLDNISEIDQLVADGNLILRLKINESDFDIVQSIEHYYNYSYRYNHYFMESGAGSENEIWTKENIKYDKHNLSIAFTKDGYKEENFKPITDYIGNTSFDPNQTRMFESIRRRLIIKKILQEADYTNDSGEKFWGNKGAGVLPICTSTKRILIGLRSADVNEPHTYGLFGGAIDNDENPSEVAKRELVEEIGYGGNIKIIPAYVFKSSGGGFQFHNFLGLVKDEFEPTLDWETESTMWLTYDELLSLPNKHFGLKGLLDNSGGLIMKQLSDF